MKADTKIATCAEHGIELERATCWNCLDGFTDHDCGEDCCCCADPEDNVICDICNGQGSYMLCPMCAPDAEYC